MDEYVRAILTEASKGKLRGQNISAEDQALAMRLLQEYKANPSQVSGTVVGLDLRNNQIHVSPWPGRPGGN